MECPYCGSTSIGFEEYNFANMSGYYCYNCGAKWIQQGKPQPIIEMEQEAKEYFTSLKTYCLHGIAVWSIEAIIHFFIVIKHPFDTLVELSLSDLSSLIVIILVSGLVLGCNLLQVLRFTGKYWPDKKKIHIIVPLILSAFVGSCYGVIILNTVYSMQNISSNSYSADISLISGAILGIASTPIIIIRSIKALQRKGLRFKPQNESDPRWQL